MMTRRVFLRNGSAALVSLGFTPAFIARAAQVARARQKILVAVFQRGAVDGLNMVVPFGERAYYQNRPSIAIPKPGAQGGALDLDGFFGLHPRMAPLVPYFKDGNLAIVHASGSPDDTRSHFDAQDYMESGTPGLKSTRDGWMNRYLHAKDHAERSTPFRAVALTQALPRSMQGSAPALAIGQLGQFGIRAGQDNDVMMSGFEAQYSKAADAVLGNTGKEAFDAVKMLKDANPAGYTPANGAEYPRAGFGDAMRQIAQIIKADLGLEVAFAELGQWDHHANEGASTGQIANRLGEFAEGIAAFARDLGDRMQDVMLITMSEFGRTVRENGNRGTDHGHGNAMLILGGNVKGGKVYGKWPGLEREQLYAGRDLAITTDFRDVFAEALSGHMGATDVSKVFPGFKYGQRLGFVKG
ncbi:MAG TPA: DUF1501 domain-containing protein [Vicinamibacterales bacterium]|nr:DUF1501 domain-containing protein [Vicinamibacterales bacterium]